MLPPGLVNDVNPPPSVVYTSLGSLFLFLFRAAFCLFFFSLEGVAVSLFMCLAPVSLKFQFRPPQFSFDWLWRPTFPFFFYETTLFRSDSPLPCWLPSEVDGGTHCWTPIGPSACFRRFVFLSQGGFFGRVLRFFFHGWSPVIRQSLLPSLSDPSQRSIRASFGPKVHFRALLGPDFLV